MRFEFSSANLIIFGEGSLTELPVAVRSWGQRALVVLGKSRERASVVMPGLQDSGIQTEIVHVAGEPTVELVQNGLEVARAKRTEMVIAMGGGSALDAGKAIAALLTNAGEIHDYLEVVGRGQTLHMPSLPFAAVPTTAGTGTEVTRNAVLTVTEKRVKVSLRGPALLPRLAIVDPTLTYGLPRQLTAASGLDALVQLIEPFVSTAANPMTDALCRDGIRRIAGALRRVCEDGSDREARADMALGALYSGMALANAKLGAVHGFAGPIGGSFRAPHGAICGSLLPTVVDANIAALQQRAPESSALRRFDELARLLTGDQGAAAEQGATWLRELCADLRIPRLQTYGVTASDLEEITSRAKRSSSMKGNPILLTDDELIAILEKAL